MASPLQCVPFKYAFLGQLAGEGLLERKNANSSRFSHGGALFLVIVIKNEENASFPVFRFAEPGKAQEGTQWGCVPSNNCTSIRNLMLFFYDRAVKKGTKMLTRFR